MKTEMLQILLSGNRDGKVVKVWQRDESIKGSLAAVRGAYRRRSPDEEHNRLLGAIARSYQSLHRPLAEFLRLVEAGQQAAAGAVLRDSWDETYQATTQDLNRLLALKGKEIERTRVIDQVKGLADESRITDLALWALVLSIGLALGITFSLTRPISRLIETTERVARGELETKAEIISNDEIGFLARRFNEMLDRLNKSNSDLRNFYADISHELRTPLTVIRGEAEVALRGPGSLVDYREALETIIAVSRQLGRLVDELLFLTRSEIGQIQYQMEVVELTPIIEEVARQSGGFTNLKGIEFNLDLAVPIAVWGDADRLRQLAFILLDNAIKYTLPGGKVTLMLAAQSGGAKLQVSDTGIGVPEQDLPRIFERLFRGKVAAATDKRGTGLGLSIAKSIVEAHKGEIFVESELGRGTTITVGFPVSTRN